MGHPQLWAMGDPDFPFSHWIPQIDTLLSPEGHPAEVWLSFALCPTQTGPGAMKLSRTDETHPKINPRSAVLG